MQQFEFELNDEFVELNQLLKLIGLCDSGGAGKMLGLSLFHTSPPTEPLCHFFAGFFF